MARVLTNGKVKIGAYKFSDRKKPCLCIAEEVELLFMGISTHLKAQKNLWKNSVN